MVLFSNQAYADLSSEFSAHLEHKKINQLFEKYMPKVIAIEDSDVELGEISGLENMSFSGIKADLDLKTRIKVEKSGLLNAKFFAESVLLKLKDFDYLE